MNILSYHLEKRYHFDTLIDKKQFPELKRYHAMAEAIRGSITIPEDVIPLWIADMEFRAPQELIDAIKNTAEKGLFCYPSIPDSFPGLARSWVKQVHGWDILEEGIFISSGVVHAALSALLALTQPGDEVIACTPLYAPYFLMIERHHRVAVEHPIRMDGERMELDFDYLETQIGDKTKLFFLCNPHNPGGRAWSRPELEKIAEICLRKKVIICENAIHSDIVYSDSQFTPMASLGPEVANHTISFLSPSKTFNLGGMKLSYSYTGSPELKRRVKQTHDSIFGLEPITNIGIAVFRTVYEQGYQWYRELMEYLEQNRNFAVDYINTHIPVVRVMVPEASYLLWLDFRKFSTGEEEIMRLLVEKAGVFLSAGSFFGSRGEGFMRLNLACPRAVLEEALGRIRKAF